MENRPRGREKNISGQGKDIYKRGEGLGTGPVGSADGHQGRPGQQAQSGGQSGRPSGSFTRAAGRSSPILIIIVVLAVIFGKNLFNGNSGSTTVQPAATLPPTTQVTPKPAAQSTPKPATGASTGSAGGQSLDLASLLGGLSAGNTTSGWTQKANVGVLDTSVASGARARYTKLLGKGKDKVNIMVYMCGTDLESRSGMATSDLSEMASATLSDNVRLLVYTGGCSQWNNRYVSPKVNQIYQILGGGRMQCVNDNAGATAMTKPDTLSSFLKWCGDYNKQTGFDASRNILIFWDHGGGSLSGYGYDEKFKSSGSMTLKGINEALKAGKMKFDIIGFDTCLMATTENALMLNSYGDYMVASEETEPGVGWYYTNWLTKLSANPSMSSLEIGKIIVDDFVDVCAQKCAGQKTTLSVVDLAELAATAPQELKDFSTATSALLQGSEYKTVSNARSGAREFSSSSRIDQVDLVSFATRMGTQEGQDLAKALLGAVKYNRTSSNMTDAYGLSIYFPYQKVSKVDSAVATFEAIGMDDDYMRCIQQFASMETGGQAVSGGASNPLFSLLGGSYGSTGASSSASSADMISQLLGGLLGGDLGGVAGLTTGNSSFLGKGLPDVDAAAQYLYENRFHAAQLVWTRDASGRPAISLGADQWGLIQGLELNVFYDDGAGYIDLGLDNVYEFTDDGALLGTYDGTWLAINDQPVAYYHEMTYDDGTNYTINGRVPVMLNGERAELILVFDNANPAGYIAGARYDYRAGETETVAKALTELQPGDTIEFLCDYYGYDGSYQDSYYLGEAMTVTDNMVISNVYIDAARANATYRFTDIYNQTYWTPVME